MAHFGSQVRPLAGSLFSLFRNLAPEAPKPTCSGRVRDVRCWVGVGGGCGRHFDFSVFGRAVVMLGENRLRSFLGGSVGKVLDLMGWRLLVRTLAAALFFQHQQVGDFHGKFHLRAFSLRNSVVKFIPWRVSVHKFIPWRVSAVKFIPWRVSVHIFIPWRVSVHIFIPWRVSV